ncbi:hypothetical protein EJB05_29704, partial [Eragrostis curvula]
MATATSLPSATRRFAHSASAIVTRDVTGSHKLTIDGYAQSRKIPKSWRETSQTFEVAGYTWQIRYFPHGYRSWLGLGDDYVSLYLELVHGDHLKHTDPLRFSFALLDQAGNPVPKYTRSKVCLFREKDRDFENARLAGFPDFIRHKDWPKSTRPNVTVPPSDLHKHLNKLLWEKHGTDVTLDVAGETFHAHMWLLAARSPVFKAAIANMTQDKKSSSICSMKIDGIEPKVFKAMLHFMYTDSLPDDMLRLEQQSTALLVHNLIAAAQRYELERLKLMCEEALCKRIEVGTVAAIMAVAEQHRCHALKAACIEFIGRPGNLKAVMETQGFDKIKAYCPAVMTELVMKQLA